MISRSVDMYSVNATSKGHEGTQRDTAANGCSTNHEHGLHEHEPGKANSQQPLATKQESVPGSRGASDSRIRQFSQSERLFSTTIRSEVGL